MPKHWEYNKNLDRSALYNVELNMPFISGYTDEGRGDLSSKEANNNLLKNNNMFELDYTYEECLGKKVFVKVMVDEEDHDTEVWIISKQDDYDEMKKDLEQYENDGVLDEYWIED